MQKRKTLLIFTIVLAIVFIGLQIFNLHEVADYVWPIILPFLTISYYLVNKDRTSNFFYFLLFFSIGELSSLFGYYAKDSYFIDSLLYYVGKQPFYNCLYIFDFRNIEVNEY